MTLAHHGSSVIRNPLWGTMIAIAVTAYFFIHPYFPQKEIYTWFINQFDSERSIFVWGTFTVHSTIFIVGNLFMQICYSSKHRFFEQYKIQKNKVWPWERSSEEAAEYRQLIYQSIGLLILNHCIFGPLIMSGNYDIAKARGMQFSPDTIPAWYIAATQLVAFMIIEDTLFYWAHRALHHKSIYRFFHKYHHSYKTTIGIASEHTHPVEFFLSNGIPFMAGPLLFGCHMTVFWQWTLLRIAETIEGHSGYEFPWSPFRLLPFSGSASAHDYHHSHNVGNFSSFFTWWDSAMGTDVAFLKHEAKIHHIMHARVEAAPTPVATPRNHNSTDKQNQHEEKSEHVKAQ